MFELRQVGESTYYINGPTKIGIYVMGDRDICLIDSGYEEDAARVYEILQDKNWHLDRILNTHSHADHIGANHYLQNKTGCKIYCNRGEMGFVEYPVEEGTVMYGAYPSKALKEKCTQAKSCVASPLTEDALPSGFEILSLPGHSIGMTGFKTPDNVWFLADSLVSESFLQAYHTAFIFDVKSHLQTLDRIKCLDGEMFVPSHVTAKPDVRQLVDINIDEVAFVSRTVLEACGCGALFDDILKFCLDRFGYELDYNIYLVIGSLVRSYLSYLQDVGKVEGFFDNNRLYWRRTEYK